MAKGYEVLTMLCPDAEWVINGNNYSDITWIKEIALTEKQFNDGFAQYDAWKEKNDLELANKKNDLLNRLGVTNEEISLLLG